MNDPKNGARNVAILEEMLAREPLHKFILFATALKLSLSRSRAQVPENVDTAMFLARAPASPPPK